MEDSLVIKEAVTIASPLIKSLVDTFVTPKLEKLRDKFKDTNSIASLPIESHFVEYFHRTYKRLMIVNTLVFNNSQRFLSDIYIPLTIECKNNKKVKLKITGFPAKLSDHYSNILITDTAGMGKSTLMKRMFIDCINEKLGIPIFIELRRLSRDKKIIDEIIDQLNSINENFDKNLLYELITQGDFIFIFDGYDEISLKEREVVTTDIQDFIAKAGNNKYFITSRPEKSLFSFGNFQEFFIHPLTKKEAFNLLRKYDNRGQLSSLLIKKLDDVYLQNIAEFLVNPLLVSLLFTAFEHKQTIPFKKHLFYRQVYDANFENHDLTKGDSYIHNKYSNLEIDDFHRVLRYIGYLCLKSQKIEFTKDEILKLISESKIFCVGLEFKESNFLLDILKTVPLFSEDGNYYKWSHKSLQEYFAAQFIFIDAKEDQTNIIHKMYTHEDLIRFINVFDLYYDMDYKTFRYNVEFKLLEEYKLHFENYHNVFNEHVDYEDLKIRAEITFLNKTLVFRINEDEHEIDQDDNITIMISKYSEENNLRDELVDLTMNTGLNVNLFQYIYNKSNLFHIFFNKNNAIVKFVSGCNLQNDHRFLFNFIDPYNAIEVINGFDQNINTIENFNEINNLMINARSMRIVINHDEALKRYDEIKTELNNINNRDLLEGL